MPTPAVRTYPVRASPPQPLALPHRFHLGVLYQHTLCDYGQARAAYSRVLALDADNEEARSALAYLERLRAMPHPPTPAKDKAAAGEGARMSVL